MSTQFEHLADEYSWAIWLAAPLVVTMLAAAWLWWRGRSRRLPGTKETIAAHHRYLETLSVVAVGSQAAGSRLPASGRTAGDADDNDEFDPHDGRQVERDSGAERDRSADAVVAAEPAADTAGHSAEERVDLAS